MKTICFYFQVHQPWRLKTYRFFNMGVDHNYLDDLTNHAILQKVARQCYLPMNALLLNLIKEQKGKFRCSFSITGSAVEQFRGSGLLSDFENGWKIHVGADWGGRAGTPGVQGIH